MNSLIAFGVAICLLTAVVILRHASAVARLKTIDKILSERDDHEI